MKNTKEKTAQHFVAFGFRSSDNTFWGHPLFMLALKFKSQVRARTPTTDAERWLGQNKTIFFIHSMQKLQEQWKWNHLLYESFSCLWQVNRMKAGKMDWKRVFWKGVCLRIKPIKPSEKCGHHSDDTGLICMQKDQLPSPAAQGMLICYSSHTLGHLWR